MATYGFWVRTVVYGATSQENALESLKSTLEGPADLDVLEIQDAEGNPMIGSFAPASGYFPKDVADSLRHGDEFNHARAMDGLEQ